MKPPADNCALSTTTSLPSDSWSLMLTVAVAPSTIVPSMSSPTSLPSTRVCAVKFVPGLRSLRSAVAVNVPFSVTAVSGWSRNGRCSMAAESDGHFAARCDVRRPENC